MLLIAREFYFENGTVLKFTLLVILACLRLVLNSFFKERAPKSRNPLVQSNSMESKRFGFGPKSELVKHSLGQV